MTPCPTDPPRNRRGASAALAAALFAAACALASCSDTSSVAGGEIQQGTLIQLADGAVQGEVDGGARRFLGIPFAAPPLGELRWRPPAPVQPWSGVLQATSFASPCPQLPSINGEASQNEDCLYLNVWSPEPAPARALPVMVWIHGGGNQSGSAGDFVPLGIGGRFYDGRVLTSTQDVIVVSVNYRLGAFGFFAHPGLAGEDRSHPYAGNQGLLDQRAALEWVQRNIAAFGGDPDNVTIFGESAGSWDVCFQVVSPGSRGLFHRAISESGGCTTHQPSAADGAATAARAAEALGCAGAGDELACLRQVPVPALLAFAGGESSSATAPSKFDAVVDGGFLPAQPRALFDGRHFSRVPYILGSNADEGTLFFIGAKPVTTEAEYLAALRANYGDLADQIAAVYPASAYASPQAALVRAVGDSSLVCPTYDAARRAAAGGAEVFLYNFARTVDLPGLEALMLGATHGTEIAYVFGSVTPPNATDAAIAREIQGYWAQHARRGDPNHAGAVEWPRYADATDLRVDFGDQVSVVSGFRRRECDFWFGTYDAAFARAASAASSR